ncbi:TPA: hypothetical protein R4K21_001472 [Stenotrophomonas maltophilia]|nr:hypothetical protein [Stenotrophomonas maltophilia]
MKLGVIISTIVFGMSLGMQAASASNGVTQIDTDPWCNPSYCPGHGGGSGSTTGSNPEQDKFAFVLVDCRLPVQERYGKVLEWFTSLSINERLWWYQIGTEDMPVGSPSRLSVTYHYPYGYNQGYELWEIVDPYAAVPIAPTPTSTGDQCWLLDNRP